MKQFNLGKVVNAFIFLVGIILVGISVAPCVSKYADIKTILVSVGSSIIATSVVTWVTSYYIVNVNRKKEIIDKWKFFAIYKTRAEMNHESNACLEKCKKNIDIVACGMSNFLSSQGEVLVEKLKSGVTIRIISFSRNTPYIARREVDESIRGIGKYTGVMEEEIYQLEKWVENINAKNANLNLKIKFMPTYPSFSYLRIDNKVFCGFNLPLRKSQQNMGLVFEEGGAGFSYFSKYFQEIWDNEEFCLENSFLNTGE